MKKTIAAFNFDLSTRSKVLYSTSKEIPPATFIDMMFKERAHGLAFYGIAQFFQEGPRTESRTNELIRMGLKTYFGEGIKAVYNDQKATYDASSGLKKLVRSAEHGKDPEERLNTWLDKATEAFVLRLMDKENRIDRATIEAHRASYGDLSGIKSKALDPERKIALVSDLQIRANERFDRAMNHLCERVCSSVGRSRSRTLRADEILVDFKSTDFAELYQAYYSRFNIESADPFAFTLEVTLRLTKALGAQFPEKYFTAPEAREACRLLVIQLAGALTHLKEEELSIMRAGARCERGPWVLDEAINKYIEQIGAQRELARLEASASGAGSSSRSSIAASGSSVSLDSSDAAKAIPLDVTSAAGTGIEATDAPKRD